MDYYIFPFNGNSIEILDDLNELSCLGIVDDNEVKTSYQNIDIIPRKQMCLKEAKLIYSFGSVDSILNRRSMLKGLKVSDDQLFTFIDTDARIGKYTQIGIGSFIMGGSRVTSNAKIGKCVGIMHNSIIHHDSEIGDFSIIGSNVVIAGNVKIGSDCFIGSGASIKPGVTIENKCIVGMGAVVVKNVSEGTTVYGVPAK